MESEVTEILGRASLASLGLDNKSKSLEEQKIKELHKGPEPKDSFYFVYIMFLLIGLLQYLPITFFITANDYWMYKFRNTSQEIVDSKDRNTLQAFFTTWTSIVSSIPIVISGAVATVFGHKVRTRFRLLATLAPVVACFILFTGFIEIDTDTWQLPFFILTMTVIILINAIMSQFIGGSMSLISKFPHRFSRPYLFGEGSVGIFNAILQIIALALSPSTEGAALIYFIAGTSVLALTLFWIFISKHLKFVQYYLPGDNEEKDTKRPVYKFKEILDISKKLWPCVVICAIWYLTLIPTHPNVTTLIVSENYGKGDVWSDKYFVPVITFLFQNVCSLVGRFASMKVKITRSSAWIWVALTFLRLLLYVPLILLCNAYPRSHLPVVFDRDWQYILILGTYGFTSGYLLNIIFLSVPDLAPGQTELAYLSLTTIIAAFGAICSPLGLLSVKVL